MSFLKFLSVLIVSSLILVSCEDDKPQPKPPTHDNGTVLKTFHLNYKKEKNWDLCAQRDYIIFDMFDNSPAELKRCKDMGAKMICYYSSQYEDWRPDKKDFGKLGKKLGNWKGERWVDPKDPKNLQVMKARNSLALSKGCDGVDIDNIDRDGHKEYVREIFKDAKSKGLLVSQKNAMPLIQYLWDYTDMYQNEQCQQYNECYWYENIGRPVFNIEYKKCKTYKYMYSVRKDMTGMSKDFKFCD